MLIFVHVIFSILSIPVNRLFNLIDYYDGVLAFLYISAPH